MPLVSRGEVIAVLNFEVDAAPCLLDTSSHARCDHQSTIAGTIANARQFAERRVSEQETRILASLGRFVSSSLDIDGVYDLLAEEIEGLVPFDGLSLSMIDQEGGLRVPTWVTGTEFLA